MDPGVALSVSQLNRLARTQLERNFPLVRVLGEISNLTRAGSGHVYFTLKDEGAQIRCTMWRNRAQLLAFRAANGMQVELRALVTLYEARGDVQLSVESMRLAGQGDLFEAFLKLKDRLSAERLFSPERKRPLPAYPRRIGVITSPAAAALHDVLASLRRRCPHLEVVLYPAMVQGLAAAAELSHAVQTVSSRAQQDQIDVLLLVRGGGSLEDLAAFNDEGLARAIAACSVPVVSGVGHETDFTIADFVSDLRATTPTMAAELASAGYHVARERIRQLGQAAALSIRRKIAERAQRIDRAALRLLHPRERLARASTHCERLEGQLSKAMRRQLTDAARTLEGLAQRMRRSRPGLEAQRTQIRQLQSRLGQAMAQRVGEHTLKLDTLRSHLQHLGPEAVLARGYAIIRDDAGAIVREAASVRPGSAIDVQLFHGRLQAQVTHCSDPSGENGARPNAVRISKREQ